MIQQHPRLVATCKSQLIVSLVLSRPAAQPSPSAVPKSEDQRPQLGMCPGAPVAMREAAGWGGMFLKCVLFSTRLMLLCLLHNNSSLCQSGTERSVSSARMTGELVKHLHSLLSERGGNIPLAHRVSLCDPRVLLISPYHPDTPHWCHRCSNAHTGAQSARQRSGSPCYQGCCPHSPHGAGRLGM